MLASSDDEAEMPIDNPELNAEEMETRGRSRKRQRDRSVNPEDYAMDEDEGQAGSSGMKKRNLTPAQRTVSA